MSDDGTYEVYALRYAARGGSKAAEFYGFDRYGEPDEPYGMDYYFWLARNGNRTVLVDCGYSDERADAKGRYQTNDPKNDALSTLDLLDVSPADVDHVVLSHMHYDHVGNVHRFPNATFTMARAEYEFWMGPWGERELVVRTVDSDEKELIRQLRREERLTLIEESAELYPGITATRLGGHTPGQLMTEVRAGAGSVETVLLASDAIHFYEEYERDRPFWFFCDLQATYEALALFRERDARPDTVVIPGHDPRTMDRFATVQEGRVVDLAKPVEGAP